MTLIIKFPTKTVPHPCVLILALSLSVLFDFQKIEATVKPSGHLVLKKFTEEKQTKFCYKKKEI